MMPVIGNAAPPAYVQQELRSRAERIAESILRRREEAEEARNPLAVPRRSETAQVPPGAPGSVALPVRIPADCVSSSAAAYQLNPMVLLAILKVESNGRTGIVMRNTNGSYDLGPAQFNTNSWAKKFQTKYNIPREALVHDMCQSVRAMAFAVRSEINDAGGDMWRGIGNYHSRNEPFHTKYVHLVDTAHRKMLSRGRFD